MTEPTTECHSGDTILRDTSRCDGGSETRRRVSRVAGTMLPLIRDTRDFLAYLRFRAIVRRDWRARHRQVLARNPGYGKPVPAHIERDHLNYWRRFNRFVKLDTLRICAAVSGRADIRIVPEEVFAADVGRCLNLLHWAPLLSHKSFYRCFFDSTIFPRCYLHGIAGQYYDANGQHVDVCDLGLLAQSWVYPLVIKPNTGTSGGRGVQFASSPREVLDYIVAATDFVVQEQLSQHAFFESFNCCGLNTIRVYTYRSPSSGQVHVLNAALRMGRGGSLDNETAGGIVCFIRADGTLNDFALDKHAVRFDRHPDTMIRFSDLATIPQFVEMQSSAMALAQRLPMMAVAGWDMCLDVHGRWRCIEANLSGHTIRFAQYAGQPFLGEHTDEVVAYCLSHQLRRRMDIRAM